ncbi:DUF3558 domain-containing protein [Streptomyces sp. 24-1644]|uniref:DUF3558 domain-containing protein n=1 Tax=Streptomyces sp. 24-1644 TaxID=3457315 RepID=UPI003FA7430F
MHRSAPRLSRILACAAVPVMLVVAGCSSDDGKKNADASASASAKPKAPTVEPAKFSELPDPCKAIAKKTISSLVPKAKVKDGTPGESSDVSARAGCSWNGLDDNGVKGSQYRWLDVGFTRFVSDLSLGSGAKRATEDYTKQVAKAQATEDAKKLETAAVSGIGEQATAVTYDLTKTKEDFEYATVVARTGNVVVTLTYNGAGYAGAKAPSASDILKGAEKAAKEAIASVATANAAAATDEDSDSATTKAPAPGKSSAKPSAKTSAKSSAKS